MSGTLRFLIADDNDRFRQILRGLIAGMSPWTVVAEARDGIEAVERVAEYQPDVVLIDVVMPGMNGIEATRQIKQASPTVRVIVISAHRDEEFCHHSLSSGADCFMWKDDLDAHSLRHCVQHCLARPLPSETGEQKNRAPPTDRPSVVKAVGMVMV